MLLPSKKCESNQKDTYDRMEALKLYRNAVDMYNKANTLNAKQQAKKR